jgi:hypothetical protein
MTKKEIATLSFRVLSLYAFIKAIEHLSTVIYYAYQVGETDVPFFMTYAVPVLLLALCGVILWFSSPLLASSISKTAASEDNSAASLLSIQTVAFSIVGLYMIADSLPPLIRSAIWHFTSGSVVLGRNSPLFGVVAGSLIEIAIGLWLLFGSRGLVNFIAAMRRD